MQNVVGIKFENSNSTYSFLSGNLDLQKNDEVVVDTENGLFYGVVITLNKKNLQERELRSVVRKLTDRDREQLKKNRQKELLTFKEIRDLVAKQKKEMKIIRAEYNFDLSKLIISFTSEGRVDFRDLVKELASTFKTRIELKQIGIRDEAKIIGGMGPCGRAVCCANHLKEFGQVSIKMAKNQGLSLNPTGISGVCGRLMCCLSYEDGDYSYALSKMPKLNSRVKTADGEGVAVFNNVLKNEVSVKFIDADGSFKTVDYPLEQITFGIEKNDK